LGIWDVRGSRTHHHANRRRRETTTRIIGYEVLAAVDALRRTAAVLELSERVGAASRYALVRRDVRTSEDPVRATDTGNGSPTGWRVSGDRGEPASGSTRRGS
jgi:hypothetical protein